MQKVLVTLTYRPGVECDESHIAQFLAAWSEWCKARGFVSHAEVAGVTGRTGRHWWEVLVVVPQGINVPHLDKAGLWPYGLTQVVRYRRQVAAHAVGWFAGLYARWPIRVPPEFLTHSRSSAPDASQPGKGA